MSRVMELNLAFRQLTEELLQRLSGVKMPTRFWQRIVRKDDKSAVTTMEGRPDFLMLVAQVGMDVETLDSFTQLVRLVRSDQVLCKNLLTNRYGDPVSDGLQVSWLSDFIVRPFLHAYLSEVGEVRFDERIFDATFDRVVHDLEVPTIHVTRLYPLFNLEMSPEEIELAPGFRLRRLTTNEIEQWLNRDWGLGVQPPLNIHLLDLQCAIEDSFERPRPVPKAPEERPDRPGDLVRLLRLMTGARVQVVFTEEEQHSLLWHRLVGSWPGLLLLTDFRSATLTEQDARRLRDLWRRLNDSPNAHRLRLALERCGVASDRLSDEDRLVDYWIALESIFAPDGTQETSYRASLRAAAYLSQREDVERDPVRVYTDMKKSYAWRSAIVHGNSKRKKNLEKEIPLAEISTRTYSYLREALLRILEFDQVFRADDLEEMLLKGTSAGEG